MKEQKLRVMKFREEFAEVDWRWASCDARGKWNIFCFTLSIFSFVSHRDEFCVSAGERELSRATRHTLKIFWQLSLQSTFPSTEKLSCLSLVNLTRDTRTSHQRLLASRLRNCHEIPFHNSPLVLFEWALKLMSYGFSFHVCLLI